MLSPTVKAFCVVKGGLHNLGWESKRRVIRWICDFYGIDPAKIPRGLSLEEE